MFIGNIVPFLLACIFFSKVNCETNINASIVIIGAGASGIAAATRLLENNFTNVKILEAEERIGGRINSVKFGDGYVDLGAEYCHGEKGNIVYSMVEKLNLLKSCEPEYVLYYSGDGQEVNIDIYESIFNLAHSILFRKEIEASKNDSCFGMVSKGVCLKHNFYQLLNNTKENQKNIIQQSYPWLRSYQSTTESCLDLDDVSLVSNFLECEGDKMLNWRGLGYKTILDVMMHKHSSQKNKTKLNVNISLGNRVSKIVRLENGQIELVFAEGQNMSADHVIFTPSLGTLKHYHKDMFSSPLPKDKIAAIENTGYGLIVKMAMHFEKPWWMIHGRRMWGCIWSAEHNLELEQKNLTWLRHFTAFSAAPENPNILIAWFAGEQSPNIEVLVDNDVLRGVRFLLSKCFVNYPELDMPKKFFVSNWGQNQNFQGAYSYDSVKGISLKDRRLRDKLASPILNDNGVPILLFAGEATHLTMYATVHGAIETGHREADRLINYYKGET